MRSDRRAVAGFFEDLPVLVFVLSGVMALVLTSTFVAEKMDAKRSQGRLDALAERIVDSVVARILATTGPRMLPTVTAIAAWNYSMIVGGVSEGREYVFSLGSLHPEDACLVSLCSDRTDSPRSTGYSCRLFNALDDLNLRTVLKVSVIVW